MYLELIILLSICVFALYKWSTHSYDYFKKINVQHLKPIPYFGNMYGVVTSTQSVFDLVLSSYEKFNCKVYGLYDQRKPLFVIKDPTVIKEITVKEFDHFVNHRPSLGTEEDANETNFFGFSLFAMKNAKWKAMRSTLSPSFTGSKMKSMFHLIDQVANETFKSLKGFAKAENGIEIEIKDYASRFTYDIIASVAFGLQVNSVHEKENEFFKMANKFNNFTTWQNFVIFLYANLRPVVQFFNLSMINVESAAYFRKLIIETMKYRKDNQIIRPDVMNLLLETAGMIKSDNEGMKQRDFTEDDIIAQCLIFLLANFEIVSLMSFTAHELMVNPDIQEKLHQEIEEVSKALNGEDISYETLQSMKYLDMVVSETLRKWPPAVILDRVCNKDFVYTEDDGTRVQIKDGDAIWIPVGGIHRDPKYYPNPEKYDPERFNDENKIKIDQFTYLPFGSGPRACIANRYALMEAKTYLFHLIREFQIQPSPKSEMTVTLKNSFQLRPKDGFWMKLVPRK